MIEAKETVHNMSRITGDRANRMIAFFKANMQAFPDEVNSFVLYALSGKVVITAMRTDDCSPGSLVMPNHVFKGFVTMIDGDPA